MKATKRSRGLCFLFVLAAAWAAPCRRAEAHKVNVFAWQEGGSIQVEAYFAGGEACRQARVVVRGAGGEVVARGETDGEGRFRFPRPAAAADLEVTVIAGPGHEAAYVLPAGEWTPAPGPARTRPRAGDEPREAVEPRPEAGAAAAREEREALEALEARVDALGREVARCKAEASSVTVEKVLAGLALLLAVTALAVSLRSGRPTGNG